MPTTEVPLPELTKQEQLLRDYMETVKGLHTAQQLAETALAGEMDHMIVEIKLQLSAIREKMVEAKMVVPHELSFRVLARG